MRNAGMDATQAGITISRRNINNLIYADDTTLMAESEEELESLLMKVKEESEKAGVKLNSQKTWSWHPVPTLQGKGEKVDAVTDFIFLGSKITVSRDCSLEFKMLALEINLLLGREAMTNLDAF